MICDIMPTISEDGDMLGEGSVEDNNFEQLMVNMLDERDKLMETLRETQDSLAVSKNNLKEAELERDTLLQQFDIVLNNSDLDREQLVRKLSAFDGKADNEDDEDHMSPIARLRQQKWTLAEEFVTMAKELFQMKEKICERSEEISELKAERANTKLLLEHLESLVSRHERSLRMTVVKRQTQTSAGVSSEVEVLKALKSLFEHHKALDEKVRERLRVAVEKANNLEEDNVSLAQENDHLQDELKRAQQWRQNNGDVSSDGKVQNGPATESLEELQHEVNEMKYRMDQKQREVDKAQRETKEAKDRIHSLEEQLNNTTKHISSNLDNAQKMQRDLDEALAQKGDTEERVITLEKRFVRSQNELSSVKEDLERLRAEYDGLQGILEQKEEKISNLKEQYEFAEQKYSQHMMNAAELPKIQEELESRKAALNAAEERNFTAEERLQNLQIQLEDINSDYNRAKEREKMTENHNKRLQETVDKLLNESNERLQTHLQEKMATIDEKTYIAQELEKSRTAAEELQREKTYLMIEVEKLRKELSYRSEGLSPKPPAPAIRLSEPKPISYLNSLNTSSLGGSSPTSPLISRSSTPKSLSTSINNNNNNNNSDWQRMNDTKVISNLSKAFVQPRDEVDTSADKLSLSTQDKLKMTPVADPLEALTSNDAQKLANVLQQQLDAINEELALLQVEHRTTEQLAEQIEKRVGSETNSLDNVSVASSRGSGSESREEKRLKRFSGDYSRNSKGEIIAEPPESNSAFLFTSYDPIDTKPLMLKSGRSQEQLEPNEIDDPPPGTPGSLPSDSTESDSLDRSKTLMPSWNMTSTYDAEREQNLFDFASNPSSITSSMESLTRRGAKSRGLKNSLGKIFSKSKLKSREFGLTRGEDNDSNAEAQRDAERRMKSKLLEDVFQSGAPFSAWNAPTILAWLELWVKLPEWYIQACRANVKSGSIMSALSDYEIQHEIGVNNPLHRLKLRIAIHEMVNVTSPMAPPTAKTALVFGDMNHFWIASEWLPSLGLPQYRYPFIENLVDARMLEHITKKEYTKYLKVVDGFHRTSLTCGTKCLEMLNYDRKLLEKRRRECEEEDKDVLVWSNARVIKWAGKVGLEEFADFLRQTGVHGAVIALGEGFDVETFAYYLQIPVTNERLRRVLEREYDKLLTLCCDHRSAVHSDMGDGDFKRSKSWRKKFKKEKVNKGERTKDLMQQESVRRHSGESDGSQHSGSSGSEVASPSRRPKKSPATDRKQYTVRSGPS